ncbi:regulator of chromosome condensation [Schistocerca cancellata]|uniref:regulator of chromosome condensation n=1 Tax=Schistocerca cancellata TaxID=274614 RepID=UPI002117BFF9|nr:regulator of chromosome condensation [Schistocerca cancellata]XP_049775648.1 regulator of chromosome condensation [Schistocerca cancellata]XP_049775649.1 regulator of chromosome condensation [Schistocerca cancellata]XP_049775650.1 regulator of chromosome condensation [Schistocerca cancellata]XP_049775651.1 regulator of chromosome condensation [Schistocerca cancellata]
MPVRKTATKRKSTARIITAGLPTKTSRKSRLLLPSPESLDDKETGLVFTFGQGDVGQLGLGEDVLERTNPAMVKNLENVVDICAGGMHTVCLTKTGEVITFGCNDEGALGRDTSNGNSETEPGKVEIDGTVVQITAGDSHTAALTEKGQVFAWGSFRDSSGSMGLMKAGVAEQKPVEILPGLMTVKIASGADHLVMLANDGHIYTCGCGEQGQLGRVSERAANRSCRQGLGHLLVPAPVPINPRSKLGFEDIWAGTWCTYAKAQNHIYVFGLNNYSQLGVENQVCHFHPVISPSFSEKLWSQICGGQHHTLARDNEGGVYVIGRKDYGRLGLGKDCEDITTPTAIPKLIGMKCTDIACGAAVSFAVNDKGEVYGWGMATNGQLGKSGDGDDESDVYEPRQIKGKQLLSHVVLKVSAGGQHTVLLAKSAKVTEEK